MPIRYPRFPRLVVAGILAMLAGCGFHLRQAAPMPPALKTIALEVAGGGALERELAAVLKSAGADVAAQAAPGVARFLVPVARFDTEALSVSGHAKVSEYAVNFHVEFEVIGADGSMLVPRTALDMARAFTYDRGQALGAATREEEIRRSLIGDMVQAMLRRVQAATRAP